MARELNIPNALTPGGSGAARLAMEDPPPSLPLQIFLFCAFLVTVAAYVVSQRAQPADTDAILQRHNEKLHHVFAETVKFQNFTKLGFQAESRQNYTEAISNFHNAVLMQDVLTQSRAEAHYNLACALLLQGKTNASRALQEFQDAVRLDPSMRDAYINWGQALMDQGKPEDAEQVYRQAIKQNPQFPLNHFKLAVALAARGSNTDALNELSEAAKLGMDDAEFWLLDGTVLNAQARYAQAETALTKAVGIRGDLQNAHFQLALSQQNQSKFAEAVSQYESILAQKPDHADALNNLALIYATASNAQFRNPPLAVSYATRASASQGDKDPRFLDTLARAYAASGDFMQAEFWEKKAIAQAGASGDKLLQADLNTRFARFQQHKAE